MNLRSRLNRIEAHAGGLFLNDTELEEAVVREVIGHLKEQWRWAATLPADFGYCPELAGVERPALPARAWLCDIAERGPQVPGAPPEGYLLDKPTAAGFGEVWKWELYETLMSTEYGRTRVESILRSRMPSWPDSAERRYFNRPVTPDGPLPDPCRPCGHPPSTRAA